MSSLLTPLQDLIGKLVSSDQNGPEYSRPFEQALEKSSDGNVQQQNMGMKAQTASLPPSSPLQQTQQTLSTLQNEFSSLKEEAYQLASHPDALASRRKSSSTSPLGQIVSELKKMQSKIGRIMLTSQEQMSVELVNATIATTTSARAVQLMINQHSALLLEQDDQYEQNEEDIKKIENLFQSLKDTAGFPSFSL
jgi:hypothetical protein